MIKTFSTENGKTNPVFYKNCFAIKADLATLYLMINPCVNTTRNTGKQDINSYIKINVL